MTSPVAAWRDWFAGPFCWLYFKRFLVLWLPLKAANILGANVIPGLSPLAFRPVTELGAIAVAAFVVWAIMRRNGEDVLLGNLGLRPAFAYIQLAATCVTLSALVSLLQ